MLAIPALALQQGMMNSYARTSATAGDDLTSLRDNLEALRTTEVGDCYKLVVAKI